MIDIYLFGKKYSVPDNLTIMRAMEYAGYQLVRGCGCRNGFCGACATIYRIKGERELKTCLACQTKVENNMYVATLPFLPLVKQVYDIESLRTAFCARITTYAGIYLGIKLHHYLLCWLYLLNIVNLLYKREERQSGNIHIVFHLGLAGEAGFQLALALDAVNRGACAAESVSATAAAHELIACIFHRAHYGQIIRHAVFLAE